MAYQKKPPTWLAHHGIEGQKWGVQHGPPYPLDSSVSTGNKLKISSNKDFTSNDDLRIKRATKKGGIFAGSKEKRQILKEKDRIIKKQQYLYDNHADDVVDYLNKAERFNMKYRNLFDEYESERDKYAEIAANIAFDGYYADNPNFLSDKLYRAQMIFGYVYDDLDQGRNNSSNMFVLDKKRNNYDAFMDQYTADRENLNASHNKLYDILKNNTKSNKVGGVIENFDTIEKILIDNGLPKDLDYVMYELEKDANSKNTREYLLKQIDKYKNSSFDWEEVLNNQ